MQEYVWVSQAWQAPETELWLVSDLSTSNVEAAIEGARLCGKGQSVPPELCPQRLWGADKARHFSSLPDLFKASGHWVVSARAAGVLRQFDLGGGALYPVDEGAFQKDNVAPIGGEYFCWVFGNAKAGLAAEASKNLRPPAVPGLWYGLPWKFADGDIAVSASVLAGPDVWIDKLLFQSLFVSRALGDALVAAGLKQQFRLFKCRVV